MFKRSRFTHFIEMHIFVPKHICHQKAVQLVFVNIPEYAFLTCTVSLTSQHKKAQLNL